MNSVTSLRAAINCDLLIPHHTINRWALSCCIALLLASSSFSEIIFQADFKGDGIGTGGPRDLVTLGGKSTLSFDQDHLGFVAGVGSIATTPPFGSGTGSFLRSSLKVTGATGGGASRALTFTPEAPAHSWAAMAKVMGPQVVMNGGFDFFARVTKKDNSATAWFRPLEVGDPKTQLSVNMSTTGVAGDEQIQLEVLGLGAMQGRAVGKFALFVGSIYHLGASFSTDPAGNITAKLFAKEGVGALGEDNVIGSATFHVDATPFPKIGDLLPSGDFAFGGGWFNAGDSEVDIDYAQFRMYNPAPQSFTELPH